MYPTYMGNRCKNYIVPHTKYAWKVGTYLRYHGHDALRCYASDGVDRVERDELVP